MKAVRTVETARVVDPKTRVSIRVQMSSRISPEAPDRKKHARTTAGMWGEPFLQCRRRHGNPAAGQNCVMIPVTIATGRIPRWYSCGSMRYGILSDTHANIEALEAV